ncbi:MAG: MinD/ParA family protein [Richelia sp. RM1_1_1]|nr:MinD/ParA family protein [Richelia sp. RM1_1_1]
MAHIISIHSFRGGTGKSNLVANLATTIMLQGKRVGIVDTDIQSPGIHVLFGLDTEQINFTLNDYLWEKCDIKDAVYPVTDALNTQNTDPNNKHGDIFFIPSSIKVGDISRILREGYDIVRLTEGFKDIITCLNLDYLLIDTHPGLNEETLISIGISDTLVIILRPDSQDFQGTAVTVDVARKLDVANMLLVVNKALPAFDFADLQQQVETNYNAPVAGILPLSEEMVRLGSKGVFCLNYPEHSISQVIKGIAKQIISSEK